MRREPRQQGLETLHLIARLHQARHGRGPVGAGGLYRIAPGGAVQAGDHLAGADLIADIHRALDQLTADAEGQGDVLLGLNGPGEGHGLAARAFLHRHHPHRPDRLGGGVGCVGGLAAGQEDQQGQGARGQGPRAGERRGGRTACGQGRSFQGDTSRG